MGSLRASDATVAMKSLAIRRAECVGFADGIRIAMNTEPRVPIGPWRWQCAIVPAPESISRSRELMNSPLRAAELQTKRKPGRPRSKRSEEAIIRATTALLADERYSSFTVSKVAARARASKSTIYRRWPTKEHLVIEAFNRWPALTPHDRGDVMSDLLDLYRQFLRILHRPPSNAIMPTLVAERVHNPALAAVFDPLMQRRREPV